MRMFWSLPIACLATACAVGVPNDPFGGVTGAPTDDDDDGDGADTDDTDSLITISETASTGETTSGLLPTTSGGSTTTGAPAGSDTTSAGPGGSSSGSAAGTTTTGGSSTTGLGEYEQCASSNTLTACGTPGSNSQPFTDDLLCVSDGDLPNPDVYDFFVLHVSSGDCVHIEADNIGGDADIMAYVVDLNEAYYGLESDYSELDDEITCTTLPWNEYACPSAGVTAALDGLLTIAVGQWGTTPSCTDNAPYTLWVAVNGVDVDMSEALVLQDHLIDPLTCP